MKKSEGTTKRVILASAFTIYISIMHWVMLIHANHSCVLSWNAKIQRSLLRIILVCFDCKLQTTKFDLTSSKK